MTEDLDKKGNPPGPSKDLLAAVEAKLKGSNLNTEEKAKTAQKVVEQVQRAQEQKSDPSVIDPAPVLGAGQMLAPRENTWTPEVVRKLQENLAAARDLDDLVKRMNMSKWEVLDQIHQMLHERETFKKAKQELRLR